MPSTEEDDQFLDDLHDRMMMASEQRRKESQQSLAIGCLAPILLLILALALAIGGRDEPKKGPDHAEPASQSKSQ